MIYTVNYPKGRASVDTDKIAHMFIGGGQLFIRFFAQEDRVKLVEFLESEGFHCVENRSYSREDTIDSFLPIVVEMNRKNIYRMGNVTCASAASSQKLIMSDRDFYLLYSLHLIQEKGRENRNKK